MGQAGICERWAVMATPLDPPVNPGSRKDKALEMERLQDQYDLATGRKSKPTPWHKEPKLSKGKQEALDQQEPQQRKSGAFDQALKNTPAPGTGTWQATPPTKRERLIAWHRSLGSPKHVVDAEIAALEQQESKK